MRGRRACVGATWMEERRYYNLVWVDLLILIYSWLFYNEGSKRKIVQTAASSQRGGNASRSSTLCSFGLLKTETATVDHFIAMIDWFLCLSYPRFKIVHVRDSKRKVTIWLLLVTGENNNSYQWIVFIQQMNVNHNSKLYTSRNRYKRHSYDLPYHTKQSNEMVTQFIAPPTHQNR